MATSKANLLVSFRGETFTSTLNPIAAPGAGKAILVEAFELQLIGGTTTVYLSDGTDIGARKLAADEVWESRLPRLCSENAALSILGSGAGLSLNGNIKYTIVTIAS